MRSRVYFGGIREQRTFESPGPNSAPALFIKQRIRISTGIQNTGKEQDPGTLKKVNNTK